MTPKPEKPKAVVLLSGGLDSSTTLAIAKDEGFSLFALSIDYGQKNTFELQAARAVATHFGVAEHRQLELNLRVFGGSSLTSEQDVERGRSLAQIGQKIPSTYVPARNTLFLSYALAWAEVLPASDIFIGVNAVDTSGYPDCRPEFIETFTTLANLATKMGTELKLCLRVHTPLQHLRKAEIIKRGLELGVDYSLTISCYSPLESGLACGVCDACILRQRGFEELGISDPLPYA